MADEEEVSWPYTNAPYLGIRLRSLSGLEYPLDEEELVMIDTGFSGEILLPKSIYEDLGFNMWEEPEPDEFVLGDGGIVYLIAAHGDILIPKIHLAPFSIRVHRIYEEEKDADEIIIGVKFAKRFRLLLDGPGNKVRVL